MSVSISLRMNVSCSALSHFSFSVGIGEFVAL